MSIDNFFLRTYNRDTYNCAHFATEVWEHLTNENITHVMQSFLLPPEKRYFNKSARKKFQKLEKPIEPCIVLMQRPRTNSHVGIFIYKKVFQITEQGVELMPLEIATRGFSKVGFYTC